MPRVCTRCSSATSSSITSTATPCPLPAASGCRYGEPAGGQWLWWSPSTPQGWPEVDSPGVPSSCLSLGGPVTSNRRLGGKCPWWGVSNRLFPPLVPAVAPAALLFACSLRASVLCQLESHGGLRSEAEKGCHTNLQGGMCSTPGALESVSNLQQRVWAVGRARLGRTNCLELPLWCWHQAELKSLGQKPWPFPEHLPEGAAQLSKIHWRN